MAATISSTVIELLDRSGASILQASQTTDVAARYIYAHVGALRAAAAILAARSTPSGWSRPRSVWEVLPSLAPELAEWSEFFAASARHRAALEVGDGQDTTVSARQADDLLRQVELFVELVQETLGVPQVVDLPEYLSPVSRAGQRAWHTRDTRHTRHSQDLAG